MKQKLKNQTFEDMRKLKEWIHMQVNELTEQLIKSITHVEIYNKTFKQKRTTCKVVL